MTTRGQDNGDGLRQALAIGAGVALPLLVFAVIMVALFDREQERTAERLLSQHTFAALQAVDRYVAADLKAMHALAHATPTEQPEAFFIELRRVINADPHWLSVRLRNLPEQQTLAVASRSSPLQTPSVPPLPEDAVQTAIKRGVWIGNLETMDSPEGPLRYVRLAVPVVRGGTPIAILTAFIKPTIYSQALVESGIPADWTAAALDRNLMIIGRSRAPEEFVGAGATDSLRKEIASGTERFFFSRNQEGALVYTALFQSPLTGWVMAVGVPKAIVRAPVVRTMIVVGIGGISAVALAILMGTVLARAFASRNRAERRLLALAGERETEQRVTDIAANLPGAIIRRVLHPDGTITYPYVSERIADVMGMAVDEARSAGSLIDWAPYVHPDDRAFWQKQVMTSARTMRPYRFDARALGSDGTIRWVRSIGHPRRRKDGAVVWDGVILDVTEAKKAEQRQDLLVQELSHRVKNTLAVVTSIARRTMMQTNSKEEFAVAFDGRLQALARAHTLLTRTRWEGSGLREVVEEALAPFRRGQGATFSIEGPERSVDPRTAITLTLVLHELATNAAKYGALSVPDGRVSISWSVVEDGTELELSWIERGGPPPRPSTMPGFGTTLITRSVGHELGGNASLTFPPAGAECRLRIPLESIEPSDLMDAPQ